MKRQLAYLIPLALLVLNLTPWALYKDTVGFSGKIPVFESLAPSSWKLIEYDASVTGSVTMTTATTTVTPANPPLSTNASFKGFPFGAYFSRSSNTSTSSANSSYSVSAYSWLWATVDGLLVVGLFIAAGWYSRLGTKRRKDLPGASVPIPTEQVTHNPVVFHPDPPAVPQPTVDPQEAKLD